MSATERQYVVVREFWDGEGERKVVVSQPGTLHYARTKLIELTQEYNRLRRRAQTENWSSVPPPAGHQIDPA